MADKKEFIYYYDGCMKVVLFQTYLLKGQINRMKLQFATIDNNFFELADKIHINVVAMGFENLHQNYKTLEVKDSNIIDVGELDNKEYGHDVCYSISIMVSCKKKDFKSIMKITFDGILED